MYIAFVILLGHFPFVPTSISNALDAAFMGPFRWRQIFEDGETGGNPPQNDTDRRMVHYLAQFSSPRSIPDCVERSHVSCTPRCITILWPPAFLSLWLLGGLRIRFRFSIVTTPNHASALFVFLRLRNTIGVVTPDVATYNLRSTLRGGSLVIPFRAVHTNANNGYRKITSVWQLQTR